MKKPILIALLSTLCLFSCTQKPKTLTNENGRIIRVPSDYSTIAEAVKNSVDGDWIILTTENILR